MAWVKKLLSNAPDTVLILAGPTGVGKTQLGVQLSLRFGLEMISADSMQLYRGMTIGTGQPTPEELRGARLHGCHLIEPGEPSNVQRFLEITQTFHQEILERGAQPLYVGGTGMYLRALRWGLVQLPPIPIEIRRSLEQQWDSGQSDKLISRLERADPESGRRIRHRDRMRVIRALEVLESTGRKLSDLQREWDNPVPRFPHRLVILSCDRDVLYQKIEARVDAMFNAGWVDEVKTLLNRGFGPHLHAFKAIGYAEIADMLRGNSSEMETRNLIKTRTRQFAKRQLTWFRKERDADWINLTDGNPIEAIPQIEKLLEPSRSAP